MKQEQIKTLIDALAGSDLSELEYSENGSTLRLVKQAALNGAPRRAALKTMRGPAPDIEDQSAPAASAPAEYPAPLYGVVHLQSSPGEPPFVQAGQTIKAGQTLCVIEAMKVFNEVQIDHDATIAEVLVCSGEEVEAGRPLFRLLAQG
ncbi:biotin/lipoyl-containing protein [Variovorax sp. YR216]|uniref:acetyl-CoA carboxylase biotin carboxyl carrier protein n=1 Tax=Variovorax sp. YR216 TaxID=1882828 RepID=UPI00089CEA78|nr:biotin/lipoyl-containing protein [Variovorax sp. YR216]SEB08988.1 biotin carboxyl carrier protein [Variovorax sp. YR216]